MRGSLRFAFALPDLFRFAVLRCFEAALPDSVGEGVD